MIQKTRWLARHNNNGYEKALFLFSGKKGANLNEVAVVVKKNVQNSNH
jgi:hypothetical protein